MPSSSSPRRGPLVCPRCAVHYPLSERFCERCGMPLVYAGKTGEEPITESHERARKVKPQYARGEPVKVGFARNQSEAELMQGLLLEEGIPSFLKRSRGFDVPDFLAAGPRDVLVPQSGAETAREVLLQADLAPTTGDGGGPRPLVLAAVIVLGGLITALIAWLASQGGV